MSMLDKHAEFFKNQHNLQIHEMDLQLFTNYCRELRNLCASGGLKAQNDIYNHLDIVNFCFIILKKLHMCNINNNALLVGIQFVGNLIVGHLKNKVNIWMQYFELLRTISFNDDSKVRNCADMVIYNLLLDIVDVELHVIHDRELMERIITDASEGLEFSEFILEKLIVNNLEVIYQNTVHEQCQIYLLKFVRKSLIESQIRLSIDSVNFIKVQSKKVLPKVISTNVSDCEAKVSLELLKTVSKLSYNSQYQHLLQNDAFFTSFIIDSFCTIHKLGLEGYNVFTPYSRPEEIGTSELPYHPLFGIKGLLLRIIGNLCCKNKSVQDKVRQMNGIPMILDCCKYDAKNPYIMQWAILTIANLCSNNSENQEAIRTLPISNHKLILE